MTYLLTHTEKSRRTGPQKRLQRRQLQVILGGLSDPKIETPKNNMTSPKKRIENSQDGLVALSALEWQLKAEHWFLEQVRGTLRASLGIRDPEEDLPEHEFKSLLNKNGHDNLIHIAQFYLFLDALDCKTPDQIELFVQAHNEKINKDLGKKGVATRAAALKKTLFSVNDVTKMRLTLQYYDEPVFAVKELGSFLEDIMSTGLTSTMIQDLVKGGVFEQIAGPPLVDGSATYAENDAGPMTTDPRRKLVRPKPKFLEDYRESLLMMRQGIMSTA